MPTVHEEPLDMAFIAELAKYSAPVRTDSDWLIQIQANFEGKRRHYGLWEIADIGILITVVRRNSEPIRKLALLQSKRLYPKEVKHAHTTVQPVLEMWRNFLGGTSPEEFEAPRSFTTDQDSVYRALEKGSNQYASIASYEADTEIPIQYLFYNPSHLPNAALIPAPVARAAVPEADVGCRVVPSREIRALLSDRPDGYSPSYSDLLDRLGPPFSEEQRSGGWRLEEFVADVLLSCEEGYLQRGPNDLSFARAVSLRSAPISAAIAMTFAGPEVGVLG